MWYGNSQPGGISQVYRSSRRSKEIKPHIRYPPPPDCPGDLHQEDKPPSHLALITSRTSLQQSQSARRN